MLVSDDSGLPTAQGNTQRVGPNGARGRSSDLSATQHKVLQLVADGASDLEIAHQLRMTHRGVRYHIAKLFRLSGVQSRVRLINRARLLGWIP